MLFKTLLAFFSVFQVIAVHGAVIKGVGDQGGNLPAFRSKYTQIGYSDLFSSPSVWETSEISYILSISMTIADIYCEDDASSRDGGQRNPSQTDKRKTRSVNIDVCGKTFGDGPNC
ncbi:putative eka-like protein [Erysiphe necator]|uniref:Putative eka-like protein n=1 Tax=Uncinula necator TaxID=52586 RepID=A0A0B1NZX9_UNCNE|nr:putative eka-like protein [Erysiphe necator]